MNRERIQQLIDHLRDENRKVGFDMSEWVASPDDYMVPPYELDEALQRHPCGTVACLAGHTVIRFKDEPNVGFFSSYFDWAQEILGLKEKQACRLFYGDFALFPNGEHEAVCSLSDVTLDQAVAELERMLREESA